MKCRVVPIPTEARIPQKLAIILSVQPAPSRVLTHPNFDDGKAEQGANLPCTLAGSVHQWPTGAERFSCTP